MNLDSIKASLQGKKTYLAAGMGVLYIAGVFLGLWEWDERVLGVFGLGGLAFLRMAVPKANGTNGTNGTDGVKAGLNVLMAPLVLTLALMGAGCGTLSKDGPYQGDEILYRADQSITVTYELLNGFVLWEYENRQALSQWPEIRRAADVVRRHAEEWIDATTVAREQYAAFRTEQTRNALLDALTALKRSASAATSIQEIYGPSHNP